MSFINRKHSKETKKKMKENHKGMLNKKHSKESKAKISKSLIGNQRAKGHSHPSPNKRFKNSREQQRAYYKKKRAFVDDIKNVPCKDCGNKFPPECMDFDHVRGKKKFEIHSCVLMSIKVLLKEIKKCDIICANCHRIRTRKSRLLRKRLKL